MTASLSYPVIALLPSGNDQLLVGEDASSDSNGGCPFYVASGLTSDAGATLAELGNCSGLSNEMSALQAVGPIVYALAVVGTKVYATDGTIVYSIDIGSLTTPSYVGSSVQLLGNGNTLHFADVRGLASDGTANLFVADAAGIWKVPLGSFTSFGGGATGMPEGLIYGLTYSHKDAVLYASIGGGGIFSIDTGTLVANTPQFAGALDGTPSSASVDSADPTLATFIFAGGLAADPNTAGTLYVQDDFELRSIAAGVTLLAGANSPDADTGPGGNARFGSLTSLAIGMDDTIYLVDSPIDSADGIYANGFGFGLPTGTSNICKIKRLNTDGSVKTLTGSACYALFLSESARRKRRHRGSLGVSGLDQTARFTTRTGTTAR